MNRIVISALLIALLTGGAGVAASDPDRRAGDAASSVGSPAPTSEMERLMQRLERTLDPSQHARVNCSTLRCLNRALTRHDNKIVNLSASFLDLYQAFWECQQVVPVTQYGGYMANFTDGTSGETTALDVTTESDPVDLWAMVWVCGVV